MAAARDAQVTVVGGGALGCAVAYHLALAGYPDVVLLEAGELAGATTSQAAGLVGQVRASPERTRIAQASVELFARFERETGYPVDWRQTGSLRLAATDERAAEFRRMAAVAASVGLAVEFVDATRLAELCPVLDPRRVTAALWCATDGYLQPHSLTTAYAGAARNLGVSVLTGTRVTGIRLERGGVTGVETETGEVRTGMVVDAAGPWAAHLARLAGVDLPIFPVRHEYFVTQPVAGWRADLPVLRIPDIRVYARAEGSAILCGGWEEPAVSLDRFGLPVDATRAIPPDWEVLAAFASDMDTFTPGVSDAGVREVFRGWPAFTPDGRFVVGPVPGVRGLVLAAGCNAHGVSGSAGLARHLVESLGEDPSPYVRSLSPGRFLERAWDPAGARRAAARVYEDYYAAIVSD
jgi:glycine/D-amino acid oxidase-like deaminating enzyme